MRDLALTETPRLRQALPGLRTALVAAAAEGRTLTYGEASEATGGVYPPRGMGRLLGLVTDYSQTLGEPDLAALVVRADDREAGDGYTGDAAAERRRCWRHWGGEDAERAGAEREAAAAQQARRVQAQRAERRTASPARAVAAGTTARAEARPPVMCDRCFTVRSASGACACD